MGRAEYRTNQGNGGDLLSEQDYVEETGSTFDRVRFTVADLLSEAAETIHIKSAGAGSSDIANLGDRAANWLEHSAGYVRDMDPQQLRSDIEDTIRRNPGRSLIIAGVIGLVLGSVLRRR
jgi:hypothetical protein